MTFPSYSVTPRLLRALVISVVAHAVLLVQGGFQTPIPRLAQPLTATLRTIGTSAGTEQKSQVPNPTAPAARAEPIMRKPVPTVPPDTGRPLPQLAPALPGASDTPSSTAVSMTPAGEPATVAKAGSSPADGLDADGLRAYRIALAGELRRFKSYPPRAVEAGWSGTAEIGILINARGIVQSLQLTRSSGYRVLDEKALDMMRQAAPRTAVPEVLRGYSFSMKVPIAFTLNDE